MATIERETYHDSDKWGKCYVLETFVDGDYLDEVWTCDTEEEMVAKMLEAVAEGYEVHVRKHWTWNE